MTEQNKPTFERRKGDRFPWDEVRELRWTISNLATEVERLTSTFDRLMTRNEIERALTQRISKLEDRVIRAAEERAEEVRLSTARKRRSSVYMLLTVMFLAVNLDLWYFNTCVLATPTTHFVEILCDASLPLSAQSYTAGGRSLGIAIYLLLALGIAIVEFSMRKPLPEELDPSLLERSDAT